MKTKYILLIICFLSINYTADAQLFKKKKKDADSTVTAKDEKNEKGILGKLFSKKDKKSKNGMGKIVPAPPDKNVKLPESYHFSYHAKIKVINSEGALETDYYLQPDETYFAKKTANIDFPEHIVYDKQRSIEVYYAEIEGEKRKARKKMGIFTKAKIIGAYKDAPNREVKSIGDKTLLGYPCQGFEISTKDGVTKLWVTNDAPATLYSSLFASRANATGSPFSKNTMIMEASFTSAQEPNKNYQMACVALEPSILVFNNNDYKE